jgi:N-acetylglutamate synthase-like GNAT family acetyltransferase
MAPSIQIRLADVTDAADILTLQKLAYQSEAAIWNDYTIPPLTQTLPEITAQFSDHVFIKVLGGDTIIGSVRAYQNDQSTCFIGRVIVHPDYQNRGIGTQIMHAIEEHFPTAQRFELFTGTKSERNLHFYQKLGYKPCRQEALNDNVTLVYLEKFSY